jgi:hypothetical protein
MKKYDSEDEVGDDEDKKHEEGETGLMCNTFLNIYYYLPVCL